MRLDAVVRHVCDPFFRSPLGRWGSIAALTLLGVSWVATLATPSGTAAPSLVVHYTTTFGIDALGTWRDLLRLPFLGSFLLLVNVGIARWIAIAADRAAQDRSPRLPAAAAMLVAATVLLEGGIALAALLLFRMNAA